jgi:hypothetical protein
VIGVIVIILWTCTLLGLFFGAFRMMGRALHSSTSHLNLSRF